MELDQVRQVVVTVVGQREWEAQGSVRISEMYSGRSSWYPGGICKSLKSESQVTLPEKKFSVNRLFEPVSEVQAGFVREKGEGECQGLY